MGQTALTQIGRGVALREGIGEEKSSEPPNTESRRRALVKALVSRLKKSAKDGSLQQEGDSKTEEEAHAEYLKRLDEFYATNAPEERGNVHYAAVLNQLSSLHSIQEVLDQLSGEWGTFSHARGSVVSEEVAQGSHKNMAGVFTPNENTEKRQSSFFEQRRHLYTEVFDMLFSDAARGKNDATRADGDKAWFALAMSHRLSFLIVAYERRVYWYEVIECFRRISLGALLVVFGNGSVRQIAIGICFCLFFIRVEAYYTPLLNAEDDVLMELCNWQLFFILFISLLIKVDAAPAQGAGTILFVILILSTAVLLVSLLSLVVRELAAAPLAARRDRGGNMPDISWWKYVSGGDKGNSDAIELPVLNGGSTPHPHEEANPIHHGGRRPPSQSASGSSTDDMPNKNGTDLQKGKTHVGGEEEHKTGPALGDQL